MLEQPRAVLDVDGGIPVRIRTFQRIGIGQQLGLVQVLEQPGAILDIDDAVQIDIPRLVNLCVLGLRAGGHGHRILPGDMIFLRHLHGVGAGGNAGNGVGDGIPPDGGAVRRRRGAALKQLHRHRVGGGIIALHRAAERSENRNSPTLAVENIIAYFRQERNGL